MLSTATRTAAAVGRCGEGLDHRAVAHNPLWRRFCLILLHCGFSSCLVNSPSYQRSMRHVRTDSDTVTRVQYSCVLSLPLLLSSRSQLMIFSFVQRRHRVMLGILRSSLPCSRTYDTKSACSQPGRPSSGPRLRSRRPATEFDGLEVSLSLVPPCLPVARHPT